MLVLTRKSDESLTFILPTGEQMLVRVKDIRGQSLSVVIDASKDVRVVRTEILHTPEGQPCN
jgi:sRNA-binding carbon storage regulator CsrA